MNTSHASRSLPKAIGLAILLCGTLDITDALVFYWFRSRTPPMRLLQGIASVPLGARAFRGGWPMAGVGLLIHFCIATFWVCLFIFLAQKISWLFRNSILAGLLYGLIVYGCMNFIVLPLFRPNAPIHFNIALVNAILALVLFIGLPVALINRNFAPLPITPR